MQVPRFRRTSASLLAGGLATGLLLLAPAAPAATAAADPAVTYEPLNIVLLGDSYSAGNGATNDAGQAETYGPTNCYRSRVNWTEKYAELMRAEGRTVTVENHACSGGKAPDVISPRTMDTASKSTPTPADVTTLEQADTYLVKEDLCNTKAFPDEEFWTYKATGFDAAEIDFDCTRKLRPQADFITPETDLVVFTMGGNDAGFSTIVTQCFILKSGSGCKDTIDTARAKLPEIKQLLLDDIAGIRAAGLREDAKIVQLGYPYLQTDNNYMAFDLPPYAAGAEVRKLIDDGTVALASVATDANIGHPDQMVFVPGIKEVFAGHEPDATTPIGNIDRWVNQTGDGTNTSLWYHPNGAGQTAYAEVLFEGRDYGATPVAPEGPETPEEPEAPVVTTSFAAKPVKKEFAARKAVRIRTMVTVSDGSRPSGRVLVRSGGKKTVTTSKVAPSGRNVLRIKGLRPGSHRIKSVYILGQERTTLFSRVAVRNRGR